jgi:hypothetical protein
MTYLSLQKIEEGVNQFQMFIDADPDHFLRPRVFALWMAAELQVGRAESCVALADRFLAEFGRQSPATAEVLNVADPFDPQANIAGGVRHLRGLLDRFGGDLPLALAAYNAGVSRVEAAGAIPPITETREYVERVLGYYQDYQRRSAVSQQIRRVVAPNGAVLLTNSPIR